MLKFTLECKLLTRKCNNLHKYVAYLQCEDNNFFKT